MDNNSTKPEVEVSKVVSLFAPKRTSEEATTEEKTQEAKDSSNKESAFLQEMRRNMENAERLKKERLKANQGVLKSYRIKN
jgi:hypothetical protein